MDAEMNIGQELNTMIDELSARTGGGPMKIMCSRETLDTLWEHGLIYSSITDADNNTGYAARYNGIPIVVSPMVEFGKFILIPSEQDVRPVQVRFEDNEPRRFVEQQFPFEPAGPADSIGRPRSDHFWTRSSFSPPGGDWFGGTGDLFIDIFGNQVYRPKMRKSKKADDADADINEDSFMNIIKGGSDDVSE